MKIFLRLQSLQLIPREEQVIPMIQSGLTRRSVGTCRKIDSESGKFNPYLDCNKKKSIDLVPNGIQYRAESISKCKYNSGLV